MTAERSILVTGASTGIGRAAALRLAGSGWRVFATVRRQEDAERLAAGGNGHIHPVRLDVTDRGSVLAAAAALEAELEGRGLDALLNNAGIGLTAPVEFTSDEALQKIFDVNLFGQVAVIRAFLPLLRLARGRILNIGSVADHLTPPFAGAMAASKAAFASMSSALRLELKEQGIDVVIIEPGSIDTPAVDKTLGSIDRQIAALGRDAEALYGQAMRTVARTFARMEHSGSPPEAVAAVIERALGARRPRTRYPAGKEARKLTWLAWALPEGLLDAAVLRTFGLPAKPSPSA
jgi:NAD(P)-dependent dehydrogenase (short-subunit alcohol dehydrogenase family)